MSIENPTSTEAADQTRASYQSSIENMRMSKEDLAEFRRRRSGEAALDGVGLIEPDPQPETGTYDQLFDPDYEGGDVASAARRHVETDSERMERERRTDDAKAAAAAAYKRPEMQ
jgi:hypothetical protein